MYQKTLEQVSLLIVPILAESEFELVDLQLQNEQDGLILRVTIYKDSGISVGDCGRLSREIGHLLEVEDPIGKAFRLEVSSPGLTRPLQTERDFVRNLGKKVKIKFAADDGSDALVGVIAGADAQGVVIKTDDGEQQILLTKIHKAKLVIEF